ncbi:MAG: hypothetical protein J6I48_01045 [Lachnospira sp.]|nr:hypothetical protein [Lachnospira sp.]
MLLKRQLKEWADGKAGTDDVIKSVYDIAYNYIVDNGYVEQMFNPIKETAESEVNFTSWRYSDYLTLFLMISLFKNEQEVINRIADVIQMNMEKKEGTISDTGLSDGAFLMKNASTHINIEATVEVKPLMMALPFMAETTTSQLSGTKWYTVKYKGTAGY